jgi:hypothetical protein
MEIAKMTAYLVLISSGQVKVPSFIHVTMVTGGDSSPQTSTSGR